MKCVYCNSELVSGAQFCPECGKEQPSLKPCVSCGQPILANAVYCEHCGAYQRGVPSPMRQTSSPKNNNGKSWLIVLVTILGFLLAAGICWAVWEFVLNDKDMSDNDKSPAITTSSVNVKTDAELKQEILDSLNRKQGIAASNVSHRGLPSRVVVTGTGVRLRYTPEINKTNIYVNRYGSPVYPRKGQSIPVVGEASDFYLVSYKGQSLYISKLYASPRYD